MKQITLLLQSLLAKDCFPEKASYILLYISLSKNYMSYLQGLTLKEQITLFIYFSSDCANSLIYHTFFSERTGRATS